MKPIVVRDGEYSDDAPTMYLIAWMLCLLQSTAINDCLA
jgi:hypothetical protein